MIYTWLNWKTCNNSFVTADKQFHKLQSFGPKQRPVTAFRCGTPHLKLHSDDQNSSVEQFRRRNSYGEAVRAYSANNCDGKKIIYENLSYITQAFLIFNIKFLDSRVYRLKTSSLRSKSTSISQRYSLFVSIKKLSNRFQYSRI